MRQWIGIFLLATFTFTGTEVHQLLKLPMLLEHYAEHQATAPMNWWDFLEEHYAHERHHHSGEDHHHDLPFHCDHHCGAQTIQAQLADRTASAILLPSALDVELISTEDRISLLDGPADIWQPPRA